MKRLPSYLRARGAPVEELGWLLFPAHFVLALLLLQPYFAPLERGQFNLRAPGESSNAGWLLAALVTAAIAVCPARLSVLRGPRASLATVVGMMLVCSYATLLASAVVRVLMGGPLRVVGVAAVFGIPAALVSTMPFLLLDLPVFFAARGLQREATCEDTDCLIGLVGLHMLAVTAVAQIATSVSNAELWLRPLGKWASIVLLFAGAALVAFSGWRMWMRAWFVARVRRGKVPRYVIDAPPRDGPLPALTRRGSGAQALILIQPTPQQGSYRTASVRVPIAMV